MGDSAARGPPVRVREAQPLLGLLLETALALELGALAGELLLAGGEHPAEEPRAVVLVLTGALGIGGPVELDDLGVLAVVPHRVTIEDRGGEVGVLFAGGVLGVAREGVLGLPFAGVVGDLVHARRGHGEGRRPTHLHLVVERGGLAAGAACGQPGGARSHHADALERGLELLRRGAAGGCGLLCGGCGCRNGGAARPRSAAATGGSPCGSVALGERRGASGGGARRGGGGRGSAGSGRTCRVGEASRRGLGARGLSGRPLRSVGGAAGRRITRGAAEVGGAAGEQRLTGLGRSAPGEPVEGAGVPFAQVAHDLARTARAGLGLGDDSGDELLEVARDAGGDRLGADDESVLLGRGLESAARLGPGPVRGERGIEDVDERERVLAQRLPARQRVEAELVGAVGHGGVDRHPLDLDLSGGGQGDGLRAQAQVVEAALRGVDEGGRGLADECAGRLGVERPVAEEGGQADGLGAVDDDEVDAVGASDVVDVGDPGIGEERGAAGGVEEVAGAGGVGGEQLRGLIEDGVDDEAHGSRFGELGQPGSADFGDDVPVGDDRAAFDVDQGDHLRRVLLRLRVEYYRSAPRPRLSPRRDSPWRAPWRRPRGAPTPAAASTRRGTPRA